MEISPQPNEHLAQGSLLSLLLLLFSGSKGVAGMIGHPGLPGRVPPMGNLIVRHSQTRDVPMCPNGGTKLWDGYSLLNIEGNERAHSQDLGELCNDG